MPVRMLLVKSAKVDLIVFRKSSDLTFKRRVSRVVCVFRQKGIHDVSLKERSIAVGICDLAPYRTSRRIIRYSYDISHDNSRAVTENINDSGIYRARIVSDIRITDNDRAVLDRIRDRFSRHRDNTHQQDARKRRCTYSCNGSLAYVFHFT